MAGDLRKLDFLQGVDPSDVARIEAQASTVTLQPGDIVFRQGETADAFYVVLEGEVRVVSHMKDGASKILATLPRGSFFGEMGLLDGEPRGADVTAVGSAQLLRIGKDAFLDLVDHSPVLKMRLHATMARRKGENIGRAKKRRR